MDLLKSMVYVALEQDHRDGIDCFELPASEQAEDLRMNNLGIARYSLEAVSPHVVSWREEFKQTQES